MTSGKEILGLNFIANFFDCNFIDRMTTKTQWFVKFRYVKFQKWNFLEIKSTNDNAKMKYKNESSIIAQLFVSNFFISHDKVINLRRKFNKKEAKYVNYFSFKRI